MVMKRSTFFMEFKDWNAFVKLNKKLNHEEDTDNTPSGRIRQLTKKFLKDNGIKTTDSEDTKK